MVAADGGGGDVVVVMVVVILVIVVAVVVVVINAEGSDERVHEGGGERLQQDAPVHGSHNRYTRHLCSVYDLSTLCSTTFQPRAARRLCRRRR